nr:hypothetical protein [Candidatus Sigynarchaeum springense]
MGEKAMYAGYCEKCTKFEVLEGFFQGLKCEKCDTALKLIQECPKCKTLFSSEQSGEMCPNCTVALQNWNEHSIKAILKSKAAVDGTLKPVKELVEKKEKALPKDLQMIHDAAPYGRDPKGTPYLFRQNVVKNEIAWREDMVPYSDWGGLRKTGIGWKMLPTTLISLLFFAPGIVCTPLVYLGYGFTSVLADASIQAIVSNGILILFVAYISKLINYCYTAMDSIIKPYGEFHESIKLLFIDDITYLRYSKQLFWKIFNMKWLYIGIAAALAWITFHIYWLSDPNNFLSEQLAPIPFWTVFLLVVPVRTK